MTLEILKNIIFIIFSGFLIPIVIIDIKSKRIPDLLIFPCLAIIVLFRVIFDFSLLIVLDFTGAFLFLWLLWFLTKGKIGLGDVKLFALIGVTLGLAEGFIALLVASIGGIIFGLLKMLTNKMKKHDRMPFAPFLAIGSIVSFFLGDLILRIYYGN